MENAGSGHLRWLMRITAEPVLSSCDEYVQLGYFSKVMLEHGAYVDNACQFLICVVL